MRVYYKGMSAEILEEWFDGLAFRCYIRVLGFPYKWSVPKNQLGGANG